MYISYLVSRVTHILQSGLREEAPSGKKTEGNERNAIGTEKVEELDEREDEREREMERVSKNENIINTIHHIPTTEAEAFYCSEDR